ncbi:Ku protein [Ottowia sp.]|uniref:non-homologous end joining protein Ku n=1 Tax=Ottowia sp. TaxID=1898956 RepID=UPI002D1C889C|nr:Ku protein [Ottowia sp.]HOB66374.1 Ku protein [Ottowia sp.]HPZ58112.1 Ku protein [Ottowia sp.]HQD48551.1 Ku protein [Ottowia sp.]
MADQSSSTDDSTPSTARVVWKGAISFGLVHIPVALYTATTSTGVDFDWLDKRTMEPVGYKRVNKKTGKEIAAADIVKGVEVEDGHYVVLSADEIKAAFPKSTQTIEIETFIKASEIPFVYLERPYYLAPINRGEKVYALLREALIASGRVGVARVVISTKQHLAVLVPSGPALILNLLRWGGEIKSFEALKLPPEGAKAAGLKDAELKMAEKLIEEMSAPWDADDFRDSFKDEIMRLVKQKAEAGEVQSVEKVASPGAAKPGAEIIDLTELLKRSLQGGGKPSAKDEETDDADAQAPAKPKASRKRA